MRLVTVQRNTSHLGLQNRRPTERLASGTVAPGGENATEGR